MSSVDKEQWGFSSMPVHVQATKDQQLKLDENESNCSPPISDEDETLCCPSLSDILTSCSNCCGQYFCCCQSKNRTEKYPKVHYSYLHPNKSQDSIDGDPEVMPNKEYKSIFQFPQEPPEFPMHPQLPFKPNKIKLQQPQMQYTPGGTGKVVLAETESPFPAPYLHDRGPGLQTPFTEVPIQHQPRAGKNGKSVPLTTAMTQRKKRRSRTKASRDELSSKPVSTEVTLGSRALLEEASLMEKRKLQGRHMSLDLPMGHSTPRGRKRLFSMTAKKPHDKDRTANNGTANSDLEKQRKHRLIHRARTVGSSPSRQPSVDPDKLRRCQTPDCVVDDDKMLKPAGEKGRRGLALRKCKTPDIIMMKDREKREGRKRQSDSPENKVATNLTYSTSPAAKSEGEEGGVVPATGEVVEDEKGEGGVEGAGTPMSAPGTSLVTKIISTDGKRRWASRREKFRKSSGATEIDEHLQIVSKLQTLPPHISSSPSSYLASSSGGGTIVADNGSARPSVTVENPPTVSFSLYFDIQRRALTVNLMKAENLPRKPPNQGPCDPFVMMFLLPNKQEVLQSVIKHGTLNPVFQQVFEFGGILANDLKNQVLVFRVFDHDRFSKNDLIGTVIMPLKDADLYGMLMRREIDQRKGLLKQFSAGDLLFSLTYSQERHIINGIILKATNLRKADIWGLADPYVKVYLIHENKRVHKWKTEVKKNTLVPIYNESFQFDVSGMDIRNVSLEVWVMDYDWFSRNDKMGVVYVGTNSPQEVGRCHWLEILSSPEHQTSHWHTIIPYTDLKQGLPLAKHPKKSPSAQQLQSKSFLAVSHDDSDSHSYCSDTPTQ